MIAKVMAMEVAIPRSGRRLLFTIRHNKRILGNKPPHYYDPCRIFRLDTQTDVGKVKVVAASASRGKSNPSQRDVGLSSHCKASCFQQAARRRFFDLRQGAGSGAKVGFRVFGLADDLS